MISPKFLYSQILKKANYEIRILKFQDIGYVNTVTRWGAFKKLGGGGGKDQRTVIVGI